MPARKTKSTKKKTVAAATKKPYAVMVAEAIKDLAAGNTRKFISYIAIAKYVEENYDVNPSTYRRYVRNALTTGTEKKLLIKKRASYRIRASALKKTPKKRKTAKKTTTTKRTTRSKRTTTTKKTGSKPAARKSARKSTTKKSTPKKKPTRAKASPKKRKASPTKTSPKKKARTTKKKKPALNKESSQLLARGEVFNWVERHMAKTFVGLGWNTGFDLDASLVIFDKKNKLVETISFKQTESKKFDIQHSGDIVNASSSGKEGDQEQITVNLNSLADSVKTLMFVVHVYTGNKSFKDVPQAYVRLCDALTQAEKCRYVINEKLGDVRGLCFCKVFRDPTSEGQWRFLPIGKVLEGNSKVATAGSLTRFLKDSYDPKTDKK